MQKINKALLILLFFYTSSCGNTGKNDPVKAKKADSKN